MQRKSVCKTNDPKISDYPLSNRSLRDQILWVEGTLYDLRHDKIKSIKASPYFCDADKGKLKESYAAGYVSLIEDSHVEIRTPMGKHCEIRYRQYIPNARRKFLEGELAHFKFNRRPATGFSVNKIGEPIYYQCKDQAKKNSSEVMYLMRKGSIPNRARKPIKKIKATSSCADKGM